MECILYGVLFWQSVMSFAHNSLFPAKITVIYATLLRCPLRLPINTEEIIRIIPSAVNSRTWSFDQAMSELLKTVSIEQ